MHPALRQCLSICKDHLNTTTLANCSGFRYSFIYLFRFWILEWLSWFQNKQWFFSSVMKCQNNIILNQNLILRLKHHNCICTTLPVYWHHLHPKSNHRQFLLRQRLKNYLLSRACKSDGWYSYSKVRGVTRCVCWIVLPKTIVVELKKERPGTLWTSTKGQ